MPIVTESSVSRAQLRTFHLAGCGLDAYLSPGPLHPALLEQLDLPRFEHNYPLYCTTDELPQPLFRRLQTAVDAHPDSFPILRDYLELIVGAFSDQLDPTASRPISSVLDPALSAAQMRLEMLHVPARTVEKEFAALRKALSEEGSLIPFGAATLSLLNSSILTLARRKARAGFARQLEECCQRLQELLAGDHRTSAASLGGLAGSFLDASALAQALRRRVTPTLPLEPERRARCEMALATLQAAIGDWNQEPAVLVTDACDRALALCRRQLDRYTSVWKALRIARLELDSAFDPAVHSEALDAFDWTMAQPAELAALPVIVTVQSASDLEPSLASFARLLQSGLPVQVLLTCAGDIDNHPGCLPLAYQDAFALHSSMASPDHLIDGLSEMARTLRPAVAVVLVCDSWPKTALLPLARAWPLYRYHPDAGEGWHERFALQTDRDAQYEELTFAHVAALMPGWREHFRILPAGAEPPDQALPFFFVTDEEGEQSRAVFTRALSNACAAAQRRWRFLADLDPAAADRTRLEGARQAIHRVISLLREG
jgi:SAM-dependent methyltransferase